MNTLQDAHDKPSALDVETAPGNSPVKARMYEVEDVAKIATSR